MIVVLLGQTLVVMMGIRLLSILDMQTSSLLQENDHMQENLKTPKAKSTSYAPLIGFSVLCVMALLVMWIVEFYKSASDNGLVVPSKIDIGWLKDKPIIMQIGTSRVIETLFFSGYDDRTSNEFKLVTAKNVSWSVHPQQLVSIDSNGRVEARETGHGHIYVRSLDVEGIETSREIQVVEKRSDSDTIQQRIINFTGQPHPTIFNLQKFTARYTKQQIISLETAPQSVKQASKDPLSHNLQKMFIADGIAWTIKPFANGQPYFYVHRHNTSMPQNNRDKYQYFIGDRYLPNNGTEPVMIEDDGKNGIWVVGVTGDTNHVRMIEMNYSAKALHLSEQSRKCVDRFGMYSKASIVSEGKCSPHVSDNDGLWTAMYSAGQLMKYSVLKRQAGPQQQIQAARTSSLRSLKAVLLIANVAGRTSTVDAKIRHLNNTRTGQGAFLSHEYLKKGQSAVRSVFSGKPSQGVGMFGNDAGKTIDANYYPGFFKYSFLPQHSSDWTYSQPAQTTKRSLSGFISRSFMVTTFQGKPSGGLWLQKNRNGSQTVLSGAQTLYDFNSTDHPTINIGDSPIPEVLLDLLTFNGTQYNSSDLAYKADTSTDEIIGHLFVYKIAFDILDSSDPEQNHLKQTIQTTMHGLAQHLIENGYTMVDATGQGTKWAKLTRQFFTSDYTIEDAPLKSLELLMIFKLAYYITGEKKFKEEYDLLINEQGPFGYLNLVGSIWQRWKWLFTNTDDTNAGLQHLDLDLQPSDIQIQRHALYRTHFSDEQQAYLAYYLAFQLEEDATVLDKYRQGLNGYWHSISHSQCPLWYYIYQLAYPNQKQVDSFGHQLLETGSWQLSRHPTDTIQSQAYIQGSRPDVVIEGTISVDPSNPISHRTSKSDAEYVSLANNFKVDPDFNPQDIYQVKVLPADERSIHKFNQATINKIDGDHNSQIMQAATTYTLPYWLAIYHNMLR